MQRLALEQHPDKNPDDPTAHARYGTKGGMRVCRRGCARCEPRWLVDTCVHGCVRVGTGAGA